MDAVKEDILNGLRQLEALLERLNLPFVETLRLRIAELRVLLVEQRPPRLVLVGRRGAGKSSLINALFGQPVASVGHTSRGTVDPRWYAIASKRGEVEILDTRGIGEVQRSDEANAKKAILAALVEACREKPADAVLFLVKAKEIDARVDEDVVDLVAICTALSKDSGSALPIIGVVNQCDELSPPTVRLDHPDGSQRYQQKLEAVDDVVRRLNEHLRAEPALPRQSLSVIGVVSYAEWDDSGALVDDLRWRIDHLIDYLSHDLPEQAKVELARLSRARKLQRQLATQVVHAVATVCAGIAAVPIPVADIVPITTAQVGMLIAVGYISGRSLSVEAAGELALGLGANVGIGFAFREVARALVKVAFPGAGSVISAAVAYGATLALGTAAIAYFIEGKTIEEAKSEGEAARQEGERDYQSPDNEALPG